MLGEKLSTDMMEEEADKLLHTDLMKLCKMFSSYGQDSLLLATLAYNVGAYRLWATETDRKANLFRCWTRATGTSIGNTSPSASKKVR